MNRASRLGLFIVLFFAPGAAIAYDGEYVTYGGFEAVVNAFQYVALFFNHSEYGGLVFTIAAIGFALGVINAFFRGGRDAAAFITHLIMLVVGAAFFLAFVGPKGNMNIYDPTRNATATVAGVPDGVNIVATLASDIQEIGVTIANTASPRLYEDTANGTIFDLVRASIGAGDALSSQFLLESTKDYFVKCVRPATTRPASGLTLDELKKTSTDLMASFAKAADDAHFSVVYTPADPAGTAQTCRDAWSLIQPQLAAAATYASFEDAICTRSDFDAADSNQKTRCQLLMDEIPAELFNQAGPTDRFTYLRAAGLAYAMEEALRDINPERAIAADTNRRFVEQGSGFFVIANEYGPFMRAAFLAAALGTLPLLFLFLPTPYFGTVLRLFIGFFAFVCLWSVIDVGLAQIAHGIAVDAFADVTSGALAYDDLMLRPPASAKALAVFGTTRFIAISFAALFVVTVFKISGASFAAMTGSMQSTATGAGDAAANAVLNPVGRINTAAANASAAGRGAVLSQDNGSFGNFRDMHAGELAQGLGRVRGVETRSGRGTYAATMGAQGAVAGGETAGALSSAAAASRLSEMEARSNTEPATAAMAGAGAERGAMQAAGGFGSATAKWEVAKELAAKNGTDPMTEALKLGHMSGFGDVARASAAESVGAAERSIQIGAERDVGANLGFGRGADAMGSSSREIAEAGGTLDAAYSHGDQRYLAQSTNDDLNMISGAGETRRFRQEGGRRGVESAAGYLGISPGETAARAEGTLSARSLISAATARQIGRQVFGDENRLFEAQAGTGVSFTPSQEDWDRLRESGAVSAEAAQFGQRNGGEVTISMDPEGNAQNFQVMSRARIARDETMEFRGGESLHVAPSVTPETLHAMAYGGRRGSAQFATMVERYEQAGQGHTLRDTVSIAGAQHLDRISGNELAATETGSVSANASMYAGASAGGGFNAGIVSMKGEVGARASADSSDGRSASHSMTSSANLIAVQEAYDRTIGDDTTGSISDRTAAFMSEYQSLDIAAHERQGEVHERAEDPDGVFGGVADYFGKRDEPSVDKEEFDELLRRSRFKQPGEM